MIIIWMKMISKAGVRRCCCHDTVMNIHINTESLIGLWTLLRRMFIIAIGGTDWPTAISSLISTHAGTIESASPIMEGGPAWVDLMKTATAAALVACRVLREAGRGRISGLLPLSDAHFMMSHTRISIISKKWTMREDLAH